MEVFSFQRKIKHYLSHHRMKKTSLFLFAYCLAPLIMNARGSKFGVFELESVSAKALNRVVVLGTTLEVVQLEVLGGIYSQSLVGGVTPVRCQWQVSLRALSKRHHWVVSLRTVWAFLEGVPNAPP
ncbi:hypothetical protein L3X38_037027 [Prunus dulcis]|uniref:Uncharacterized protein n=1 Tax=Prunus dulcis TaxID=3755 RepID=A0AAD4YQ95_PRUDU|nr:hypothetical protein L3X38_037027 [Prunus dulcis]